jgi:hypothetical protein
MNIADLLLVIFYVLALPYIVGRMTNNIFKIEGNDETTNVWYTGIWVIFFLLVASMILWSGYKFIFN